MKIKHIVGLALAVAPLSLLASPALIVTADKAKGGRVAYSVEFAADESQPVGALIYEFKTTGVAKSVEIGKNPSVDVSGCTSGVQAPFKGMCNSATASGDIRIVVYSTSPDVALPSGRIGTITLPRSLAKSKPNGLPELGMVEFTSTEGSVIQGEVLVDAATNAK